VEVGKETSIPKGGRQKTPRVSHNTLKQTNTSWNDEEVGIRGLPCFVPV
jgi:hypothetical protein